MARGQSGQATVELALCLPLLAVLSAAVVELGLVGCDQLRLHNAAREAARVAAVDPDRSDVLAAITDVGIRPESVEIHPEPAYRIQGRPVVVTLADEAGGHVPLIGELFSVRLTATATMRVEVP